MILLIPHCTYMEVYMREIAGHWPGRIFLLVLLLSVIVMSVLVVSGATESPVLLFGWMTMPLVLGVVFVLIWLVAYLIYFFNFWPYR